MTEPDVTLNVTNQESPVPTIRTKEALDNMAQGQVLKVITSHESTIQNIRTLVKNNPLELVSHTKNVDGFVFFIKKL